jgi:hypothetical protein
VQFNLKLQCLMVFEPNTFGNIIEQTIIPTFVTKE